MIEVLYKIKVKDILTPIEKTPFLEEDSDYLSLIKLLSDQTHAWVVNDSNDMHVVGIITEKEMLGFLTAKECKKIRLFGISTIEVLNTHSKASDLMVHKPVICTIEENVRDVIRKLSTYKIRRLPVVDKNKRLIGEITIQVLVRKLKGNFKK